jgi:hypothetical protein
MFGGMQTMSEVLDKWKTKYTDFRLYL